MPQFIKPTGSVAPPLQITRPYNLPNARAGQEYSLNLRQLLPELQLCLQLKQPAGVNLDLDTHTGLLTGTPERPGDFNLELSFVSSISKLQQTCTLQLAVIQDPKNLWKNLPSDNSGVFARPDAEAFICQNSQHKLLAGSKRGRSHAHVGSFRDDACAMVALDNGWSLLIAADGAGSAQYSRRGAQLICQTSGDYLAEQLQGPAAQALDASVQALARRDAEATERLQHQLTALLGQAAYRSVAAIHAQADQARAQVKDFASTALIGIMRSTPLGTLCACYWVGDGAVAVYRQGAQVLILGAADAGEYAGQTRFLDASAVTAEVIAARTQFAIVADITAFILMTDGVSDPKFDTEANLKSLPLWDELWAQLGPLAQAGDGAEQLLAWLDFWSPGNHDDRTLLMAVPIAAQE